MLNNGFRTSRFNQEAIILIIYVRQGRWLTCCDLLTLCFSFPFVSALGFGFWLEASSGGICPILPRGGVAARAADAGGLSLGGLQPALLKKTASRASRAILAA